MLCDANACSLPGSLPDSLITTVIGSILNRIFLLNNVFLRGAADAVELIEHLTDEEKRRYNKHNNGCRK
jgi:hypothetical protein